MKAEHILLIELSLALLAYMVIVVFHKSDSFDHSGKTHHIVGKVKSVVSSCKAWLNNWLSLVQHSPTGA